jgi:predicted metal-dependent HD superfamily phosphohydrolase
MELNNLYKKTEQYVTDLFTKNQNGNLVYHNLEHTKQVVERTKEIAGHYYLNEQDMLAVYIAAWFHDTGYLFTEPAHHEEKSVELMHAFMKANTTDVTLATKVEDYILATRLPHTHESLPEQIICDADSYHFGLKKFKESNIAVWEESKRNGAIFTAREWCMKTLEMLSAHVYYTKYCKDLLRDGKQKNMKKLKNYADKLSTEEADLLNLNDIEKDKTGLMSKGIQTMLRTTSQGHLHLSDMADSKANILISVNAIIISVILSVLLRKLEEVPYLTIPTLIFLLVAVVTIVISIIATRPKLGSGLFTRQEVLEKKTNLLFFGNFYKTTFEEYDVAMREMMQDTDYLYGSLIKDIYTLGTVLGRKYKMIRLAYNIFMIGIIASVLAFGIAFFFFHKASNHVAITTGIGSPF